MWDVACPSSTIIWSRLVKSLPSFLRSSATLTKCSLGLKILVISYWVPRCSRNMGQISLPWLLPSNKIFLFECCHPSKWFYFVFHVLQETYALLINFQYTESVAQLNLRYIFCADTTGPGIRIFRLRPLTQIICNVQVLNFIGVNLMCGWPCIVIQCG